MTVKTVPADILELAMMARITTAAENTGVSTVKNKLIPQTSSSFCDKRSRQRRELR
jgi:hypothetical protein